MTVENLLLIITGPTAVGKTDLAVEVATRLNSEVVSCDSRQVYREMSIGTAVPNESQRIAVNHHFIQTETVTAPFSANSFGLMAREKIKSFFKTNPTVVMTGGSGLYIDAIINGIDDIPQPNLKIRDEIQKKIDSGMIHELQNELKNIDPDYYNSIDIQNHRRIMRGLEVFYTSGQPISQFLTNTPQKSFRTAMIVLETDRAILYKRINERVDSMIKQGLIDEAQRLIVYKNFSSLQTVGYQELFAFFENRNSLIESIEKIKSNTRRYARKQETWFRRYNGAFRIAANAKKQIFKLIAEII